MSLYDPDHQATVAPEDAVVVVHVFLERCRSFATDREIPKLLSRLGQDATAEDAAKLHQWATWRDFVDHALRELEDGRLDAWFR